jgi:hypothetical protein
MFTINPQLRDKYVDACYNKVMTEHTYCHRIANIWRALNNEEEANKSLALLNE